jgi:hypothetical protein
VRLLGGDVRRELPRCVRSRGQAGAPRGGVVAGAARGRKRSRTPRRRRPARHGVTA